MSLDIETQDFQTCTGNVYDPSHSNLPGLTIGSDLPIHSSFKGQGLSSGGSVWIRAVADANKPFIAKASKNWNQLNTLVINHLPDLRRAISCWRRSEADTFRLSIEKVPGCLGRSAFSRVTSGLQFMMDLSFVEPERTVADREIMETINQLSNKTGYRTLLQLFKDHGVEAHFDRLIDLCERTLLNFDAAIPGIIGESVESMSNNGFTEYRLFRDDYTELQSLYVEAFEVTSKLLAFLGCSLNLARRGDCQLWSNGTRKTLGATLNLVAAQREFISTELPRLLSFMIEMDRHMRNKFGHFNVRYDAGDGSFHDGTGPRLNAIEFHIDYLNHMRVLDIFLTFARRVHNDMNRLRIV